MVDMVDLRPAVGRMADLVGGVSDDQLGARTPCPDYSLGDLIDHVDGLALAFTAAAEKDFGAFTGSAPSGDATRLGDDWRTRVPARLAALAEAWAKPDAWEGMTRAGGVELPAAIMGKVALNELVIHGWDVARASGLPYDCDGASLAVSKQIVTPVDGDSGGLFGPPVAVPADAPPLEQVIALSGRHPSWPA
jgi:uncharacterized protein (TIGR03086 family)